MAKAKKKNVEKLKQKMAEMREKKRIAGGTCDSSRDSHLNALRAASPQGSLQTQTVLPPCISTPPSVPSPPGDAVQTNLVVLPPCISTSPSVPSPSSVAASKMKTIDANAPGMKLNPGRSLVTTVLAPSRSMQTNNIPSSANAGVAVQAKVAAQTAVHKSKNETNALRNQSSTVLAPSKSTHYVPSPLNLGEAVHVTDLAAVHGNKNETNVLRNQKYTVLAPSRGIHYVPSPLNLGGAVHVPDQVAVRENKNEQNKSDDYGSYVHGTFNQGDEIFGANRGKQCTVMSFMALTYSQTKPLANWKPCDMNKVLIEGDSLYSTLQRMNTIHHEYLDVQELPKSLDAFGLKLSYSYSDSMSVVLNGNNDHLIAFNSLTLDEALQVLFSQYEACFITFAEYTFIILKAGDFFYAFDSHARDKNGKQHQLGKSVLVQLHSIDDTYRYCYGLLHSMGIHDVIDCECAGANVTHNGNAVFQNTQTKHFEAGNTRKHGESENIAIISKVLKTHSQKEPDNKVKICEWGKNPIQEDSDKMIIDSEIDDKQTQDESDNVVIVSATTRNTIDFVPLDSNIQQELCAVVGVPIVKALNLKQIENVYDSISTKQIAQDGNCFYRAISYAVSGSEQYHRQIRKAVVEHMTVEENLLKSFLRPQYKSMSHYLQSSCMAEDGTWATEVEILATSVLLNTNIYTFNRNSWLKTSPRHIDNTRHPNTCQIYLKHCNNNHYEVVVSATSTSCTITSDILKTRETGQTELGVRNNLLKKRKKKSYSKTLEKDRINKRIKRAIMGMATKLPDVVKKVDGNFNDILQQTVNKSCNNCSKMRNSTNIRNHIEEKSNENGNTNLRSRYQLFYMCNEKYRQRKIESTKQKYQENLIFRSKMIETKMQKYRENQIYRNKQIDAGLQKYRKNPIYRNKLIYTGKQKYRENQIYRNKLIDIGKQKYRENPIYRNRLIDIGKQKYKENPIYRNKLIDIGKQKYKENPIYRNKLIDIGKQMYKENPIYRNKLIDIGKQKYKENPIYRNKLIDIGKQMYKENPIYRNKLIDIGKQKYKENPIYRNKLIDIGKQKYRGNENYRQALIERLKKKYKNNQMYRKKLIENLKQKWRNNQIYRNKKNKTKRHIYKTNETYRNKSIESGKQKYKHSQLYKDKLIETGRKKYKENEAYREQLKIQSISKYASNKEHKEKVKKASIEKYKIDVPHKKNIKLSNIKRRDASKNRDLFKQFKEETSRGPEYICCSCHRLLFEHQVSKCVEDNYKSKGAEVSEVAKKCISKKYLHVCSTRCEKECILRSSPLAKLWICFTCHRKILSNVIPAESEQNNLMLEAIPDSLRCLNSLEQHLVALHIPFIKVLALPKGGQHGVHGPVVCVPSDIEKTTHEMPRSDGNNTLIQVKLKRKLSYKGYYRHDFIDQKHVEDALAYLKQNNRWYSNVTVNANWINPIPELDDNNLENDCIMNTDHSVLESSVTNNNNETNADCGIIKDETEDEFEERSNGIQLDSCLQPADIGQHVLDQYIDETLNLAPAEGKNPVKILNYEGNEAKTFPVQFPSGRYTYNDYREQKITLTRYFNTRLMNADNRFAKDTNYIFFAQYMSELEHVISSVSIACRKGNKKTAQGDEITADMLKDNRILQDLFKSDQIFKFLNPVRGTPPYWQTAQKDLFAMLRQLGIPTWFCSFSSADMRWENFIGTILIQQNDKRNVKDLDWNTKCELLRSNPVTAARMFDQRFHTFLRKVILSEAAPIGKVKDYFYRVEFQKRGSPHTHCVFWIENAPTFNEDDDEMVVKFVDEYVSCEIPNESEDSELYEIVTNVQQHSKHHSKACKTKGTKCRFNFPRPPSEKTFITGTKVDSTVQDEKLTLDEAKCRIQSIWQVIMDTESEDLNCQELFEKAGQSQSMIEEAFNVVSQRNEIMLKRKPKDIWTNQYNAELLRCWNANMDIQYILDAYACIMYVISYISKAEREMGLLLRQTKTEAEEANLDAQQTMKKLGTTYLNYREVSAQESVYRVCSLRLKECSRKVQFVPVGENPVRMRLPLKYLSNESDNIWMSSINDKYLCRPATTDFEEMCLAKFCSEYRVLAKSQIPKHMKNDSQEQKNDEVENNCNVYKLQKEMGYIQKRSRTEPAIIRYPRFSVTKSPELYYQSILELFLPHRFKEQLKPPQYEKYENFYHTGSVKLTSNSKIDLVKDIVDRYHSMYDVHGKAIDDAEQLLQECEPQNAWAQLCPETELERDECTGKATTTVEEEEVTNDIDVHTSSSGNVEMSHRESTTNLFTKAEIQKYLSSMNTKQAEVFYKVRQWCLNVIHGKNPKPFHLFITGGAGVGKSLLIKCIYYEVTRLLSQVSSNPDDTTVLLMALTGTAAYNIKGKTIHSALSIPIFIPEKYLPLAEERLNTIRSNLANLQMIIIDEISMVDKKLFYYVSERLRQIKRSREGVPFGNISVIVVGDFYQIPPVLKLKRKDREKALLYVRNPSDPARDLFNDNFSFVELNQIMRQKDDLEFANMLNRCRVKLKIDKLNTDDLNMLKRCCNRDLETALHIFPRNNDVNEHNNTMFCKLDTLLQYVEAEDYIKDKRSGLLIPKKTPSKDLKTNLEYALCVAEGARVMLIRNLDVSDGLVNGVIGTVVRVMAKQIFVVFDNVNVGKAACRQNHQLHDLPSRAVCIAKIEEHVENRSGVVRKQFPLKLAWACTIHKVQGLTLDNVVVSLDNSFTAGMAYVALSRVTTLAGLHIKEHDDKILHENIYCAEGIADALNALPRFIQNPTNNSQEGLRIILHNIQGLISNISNIQNDCRLLCADYICMTETWLTNEQSAIDAIKLEHFKLYSSPRSSSYDISNSTFEVLKNQSHGGVGIYVKDGCEYELANLSVSNLEYICFKIPYIDATVVTIYRPNSYTCDLFHETLLTLVRELEAYRNCLIMGDFNQNIFLSSSIKQFLEDHGYQQIVEQATTEGGTLIDHVYKKGMLDIDIDIIPTFYSYHEAISICVKKTN